MTTAEELQQGAISVLVAYKALDDALGIKDGYDRYRAIVAQMVSAMNRTSSSQEAAADYYGKLGGLYSE